MIKIDYLVLGLLIGAGIFVRIVDLGTHFGHYDDLAVATTILEAKTRTSPDLNDIGDDFKVNMPPSVKDYKESVMSLGITQRLSVPSWIHDVYRQPAVSAALRWVHGVTRVPAHLTYAPLQFLITHHLVHPGQTYRETLFWGRLPSFIFGVLGLLLWIGLYHRLGQLRAPAAFLGLAVLAFSWENIIYAKQMQTFSIGVPSLLCLLILLLHIHEQNNYTCLRMLICGFLLSSLSYAQYQVLFFVPAFLLTLFLSAWKQNPTHKARLVRNFVAAGGVFCLQSDREGSDRSVQRRRD
jgi:hypothetical protein